MVKNKLYLYFTKELFKNFFLVLISLSLIMLLAQAAKFLSIITEMGNSSLTYLKYVILNLPRVIEKIFALSFLISIFFTFSKLKNEKEINIFWYSGVSQFTIFKIILKFTLIIFIIHYILSVFLSPYSSNLARQVLAKSDFTLVNSLVKEKNFNSPLKGLTIYVDENDKRGNIKKIFIFEEDRIISAKNAKILSQDNFFFLELIDGSSLEKINNSFNKIEFKKLLFDFSKFKTKNLKVAKFSERSIFWLLNNLNQIKNKVKDLRYEINKRLIKPFFVFLIGILASFIFYFRENKKIFRLNYVIVLFIICFSSIIINEVLLGLSSKSIFFSFFYFFLILFFCIFFYLIHIKINKQIR